MLRYFFNLCTIKVLSFSLVLEVVHWMTEFSRLSTVTLLEERLYLRERLDTELSSYLYKMCSSNASNTYVLNNTLMKATCLMCFSLCLEPIAGL